MEITILPADTYTVVNKTIMNDLDKNIISMLYQPIIGHVAVSLYLTLVNDLDKSTVMSEDYTHHHLMATMQLRLDDIVLAREKLEATGLLKTYLKKDSINHYVYLLYSPLTASEFFSHPILNIVLYNNLGKDEYEKLQNYYKIPRLILKDYDDVTKSFSQVFKTIPGRSEIVVPDIASKNRNQLIIDDQIDFNLLIASIPKNMVHEKCFTKEVRELINALSFTYNIDDFTMQSLVRDSLNEKGLIDKNLLRKSARNYYQYENDGSLPTVVYRTQPVYLKKPAGDSSKWAKMVYTFENTSPYRFLKAQYKGTTPTARDLKLIESLLVDQKLNPGVVNVLISYVLKVNNQKLNKNYIETIAGQWKRLNIETVEDAMLITEKEHKKMKKMMDNKKSVVRSKSVAHTRKEEALPAWFDQDLEKEETSKEEEEELTNLLKEFT